MITMAGFQGHETTGAVRPGHPSELSAVLRLAAVYGQCGRIWEFYPSLRPKVTNSSDGSSRAAAVDEKPLKFDGRSGGCFN